MAEFALGLTKMAVAGTVSRVKSAIEEEGKLRVGVEDDLVFITGEFEMMQAFLNVANAERANNQVVRTWVRQLRDLAFDVENCVEFIVHLDKAARWDWVRRLTSPLICMARPLLPLDVAVAEIKRLKTRVEDISQRNRRYNLISDSGSNSKASVSVYSPAPELMLQSATGHTGAASAFHILSEVWEAAGKHSEISDLKMLIMSKSNDLEVISLWGSPGAAADLGMTHVIREAYNDPEICKEFKSRAWIKLMHPFDADEFLKSLLTQFYVSSNRANIGVDFRKKMKAAVAMEDELMQRMTQQKYLVIVEELSTVVEWDAIRIYLPDSTNGSRIVVATQQLGLALSCTGKPYEVSDLRQFSDGQSLCAFFSKNRHRDEEENEAGIYSSRKEEARDWIDKFKLLGRDDEVERLDGCSPGVLSVWGIAAVGKSALVRYVYSLQMLRRPHIKEIGALYFSVDFAAFSWVDVTYPFNLVEFSTCLLLDFHSDDLEAKETASIGMMEGQDPIQGCRRFLRENECIVVINGLQSTHDWDLIKTAFLSKPVKSLIYVITTEASVAAHCTDDKNDMVNVKGLEPDVALKLLLKKAWDGKKQLSAEWMESCKLTVAKCGGLPTIIAAIGKFLAEVDGDTPDDELLRYLSWFIHDGFMPTLETQPEFRSLKGIFGWMQSYFDACSDELKPCIFYLSIFPLYQDIRRKRLLRRWIAEGYSRDTTSVGSSTAEENGKKLFSELLNLSIIQQSPINKIMCQVNGFFREYIISRPMEDNLVFALEGNCKLNAQRTGQHLTISSRWNRDKTVFESIDLSRLRSLTVFGKWMSFFVSNNINMRLLRALDLEDASGVTDGDIKQIVKVLPRLKFFSIRGCIDITHLPDSFGGLRQLQTLDVKGTSIVTLPRTIVELHKLQYICAGTIHCISTSPEDRSEPKEDDNGTSAGLATTTPDVHGASTSNPPTAASTGTSPPEGDGASTSNPPMAALTATTPPEVDGASTSSPRRAASTATTPPAGTHGVSTSQPAAPTADSNDEDHTSIAFAPPKSRTRDLVASCSWLSKKMKLRRRPRFGDDNGGVEVPAAGIRKLTDLHTLGVVNVTTSGKAVLRELLKLTQLRKLGLSGINRKNWVEFCDTIAGHGNLESLSVRLDEEEDVCSLDEIKKPPKTLKTLKLYGGNVHVSPVLMKQLGGLRKVDIGDHELTVSTQEEIFSLTEVPCRNMFRRLSIKPNQDSKLLYGSPGRIWEGEEFTAATVLKIDCSTHNLKIAFGEWLPRYVEVLLVHCSAAESSLELFQIHNLQALKVVWVKGSCSDQLKQHLRQRVKQHPSKPVLKFDDSYTITTVRYGWRTIPIISAICCGALKTGLPKSESVTYFA